MTPDPHTELWRCERCGFACPVEQVDMDANGFDCAWCEHNAQRAEVAGLRAELDTARELVRQLRVQRNVAIEQRDKLKGQRDGALIANADERELRDRCITERDDARAQLAEARRTLDETRGDVQALHREWSADTRGMGWQFADQLALVKHLSLAASRSSSPDTETSSEGGKAMVKCIYTPYGWHRPDMCCRGIHDDEKRRAVVAAESGSGEGRRG